MSGRRSSKRWIFLAGVAGILLIAVVWVGVFMRRPHLTPELRGRDVAERLGCFACHGPGGTGGVSNPGSDEKEVPSWDGGTAMMYIRNAGEIREWILYGGPVTQDHRDSKPSEQGKKESAGGDESIIEMPAYEGFVSGRDLEDLIAYYRAVSAYDQPTGNAMSGYRLARQLGCFGCHGPGGLVGAKNPRSFKGYIPSWRGKDYSEMVRNSSELQQWILDGGIERFKSNPVADYFVRRQIIQMPSYRDRLSDADLESLIAYIEWLQDDRH